MSDPLLVIDAHYMCHRAFWSQRDLSWQGVPTGVVFGFLKSISVLKERFATDRIAFCFEGPESLRRAVFPAYKQKRELAKLEPEVQIARKELNCQINKLRDLYLPTMGFKNVFCFPGYESDDVMASLSGFRGRYTVLVTSDADLYQCLRANECSLYSPHEQTLFTEAWFRSQYGIAPHKWAVVKALAGCSTDGVPGIGRCGEKTALKLIQNQKKVALTPEQKKIVHRNRQLVELPFSGCPRPEIQPDRFDHEGWNQVCRNLGLKSLVGRYPLYHHQPRLL